jgi:hypothetical protein
VRIVDMDRCNRMQPHGCRASPNSQLLPTEQCNQVAPFWLISRLCMQVDLHFHCTPTSRIAVVHWLHESIGRLRAAPSGTPAIIVTGRGNHNVDGLAPVSVCHAITSLHVRVSSGLG